MARKDKAVINMGDSGLVRSQPEFQTVFEYAPALIPDGLCLRFGAFDDKHEDRHSDNRQRRVSISNFL